MDTVSRAIDAMPKMQAMIKWKLKQKRNLQKWPRYFVESKCKESHDAYEFQVC